MAQNPPEVGSGNQPQRSRTDERLSGRAERKLAKEQAAKRRTIWTIAGAVAAVAVIAVAALLLTRKPAVEPVAVAPAMEEGIAFSGRTMGDPNAPVKVVEWGDYQ